MTWTVFDHKHGDNETTDDAPGRGGYKYVLVELDPEDAVLWWESEYGEDPTDVGTQDPRYFDPNLGGRWDVTECHTEDDARAQCGELELDQGGIGVPMTRRYTWNELRGRLDVRVVGEENL